MKVLNKSKCKIHLPGKDSERIDLGATQMAESKSTAENFNIASKKRDGNTGEDVTDSHKELAQSAQSDFNKENFGAAASQLSKLQTARPKDIKVLLNKSVAEYFKSNLKKTEIFQKSLQEICNQTGVKLDKIQSSDEIEASVVRLNHCTVLFHLHQFRAAAALLENMHSVLASLDEGVSIGLCLLLAECYLGMSEPTKALSLVGRTEATFLPQPLPPQASTKHLTAEKDSKSPEKTAAGKEIGVTPASSSSHIITSGTNIMNSHSASDSIAGSSEVRGSVDQELLRGKLQMLRVRALIKIRMLRMAKKELQIISAHAAASSGNQQNPTLINLKSQMEFLKGGNFKKAVKVLNQCSSITTPVITFLPKLAVAYYNNMGVIQMGIGKPTLACFYLNKALDDIRSESPTKDGKQDSCPLYTFGSGVCVSLYYNLGVALLHINKPGPAFDYLIEAIQIHYLNPRLWLRLAECCIAFHKLKLEQDANDQQDMQNFTVIPGNIPKVYLPTDIESHDKKLSDQQTTTDAAVPVPTLEFARICLRNSMYLIPENVALDTATDEQENSGCVPELYEASPSVPMKGPQLMQVKLSCLACSAYVSLCLGDFAVALKESLSLLDLIKKLPKAEPEFKLLGHMYCGEALVRLGRISEGISHFDPQQVGDVSILQPQDGLTSMSNCSSDWNTSSSLGGSHILRYNLSVGYAIDGQFQEASLVLKEIWSERNENMPAQVVMLAVYINLQLGHTDIVNSILKKQLS